VVYKIDVQDGNASRLNWAYEDSKKPYYLCNPPNCGELNDTNRARESKLTAAYLPTQSASIIAMLEELEKFATLGPLLLKRALDVLTHRQIPKTSVPLLGVYFARSTT
jgi:hypothetical protein